jgi:putative two-component system response regulator
MDRLEQLMNDAPSDAGDARKTVLCVDDEPSNLQVLKQILQGDYRLLFARDGRRAIELAQIERPDLILLDVMMPDMDGYEVCRTLKADERLARMPVIFVTALSDVEDEARGLELGAVDYICKPVSPAIVRARVRTHLSLVSVSELIETRLQVIQRLGLAAEYKDNETGLHVIRMSHYACILARAAGWSEQRAQELLHAAPMHDIGKIGIPDHILRKPGKFDDAEWEIMKSHVDIGVRIFGEHDSGLLAVAAGPVRDRDPDRGAHRCGRRRVRCADLGAALQEGMVGRGCLCAADRTEGASLRAAAGRPLPRLPAAGAGNQAALARTSSGRRLSAFSA